MCVYIWGGGYVGVWVGGGDVGVGGVRVHLGNHPSMAHQPVEVGHKSLLIISSLKMTVSYVHRRE